MIILITGASHTGKTVLAQELLEKYKYPYLSIDHLKMGLIRSGKTKLTPFSKDDDLTEYLWPVLPVSEAVSVNTVCRPSQRSRNLQDSVLPKLKTQLAETTGLFKGKERKALTEQIQQTEKEISERLDKLPDILKEEGYPDMQAFMATYREAEAAVEQYNRSLAEWERQVKEKRRPKKLPERESIRNRLRQLQEQGRQQPHKKKFFDRDSR